MESASPRKTVIAWDFDGVLNRNFVNGHFLWSSNFEADLGQSISVFRQHMFGADLDGIIIGKEDLRDRVGTWAKAVEFSPGPDALLDYWFEKDRFPDESMLELMRELSELGIRQVIATNQEARRAAYIEREMGYAALVERVFASGRMGVRKPDPDYFSKITRVLEVEPREMLLIDDTEANANEAARLGWRSIYFTENARSTFRNRLRDILRLD